MAIIARWYNHKFEISPSVFRGFRDLQVKGSCETTEKVAAGEKYLVRKNTQPAEITLTAHLNAFFGCEVSDEAMDFIYEARFGKSDYFYVYDGSQNWKLLVYKMMLTNAVVSKVEIAPSGKWISCDVQLTMKTCSVSDTNTGYWNSQGSGGGSSGGSGYKKTSVNSTATTTKVTPSRWTQGTLEITDDTITRRKNTADQMTSTIKKAATAATQTKKATTAKKTTTTKSYGGGRR